MNLQPAQVLLSPAGTDSTSRRHVTHG